MNAVFLKRRKGFTEIHRRFRTGKVGRNCSIPIGIPAVTVRVGQCIAAVEWVKSEMNFPTIGHAVTKGGIERANGESIPVIAVRIIKQRVGSKPHIFADWVCGIGGTG